MSKRKCGWYHMTAAQRALAVKAAAKKRKEVSEGWPEKVSDPCIEWDKRMKGRVF